jgi:hypothetical protein
MTNLEIVERKMFLYAQAADIAKDKRAEADREIASAEEKYSEWRGQYDRLRGADSGR